MKMGQDISTKMNALLKEMGLEEEFKKITRLFSDLFTIKGEETEELKEALHRAPDDLINLIWEKIEDEAIDYRGKDTEACRNQNRRHKEPYRHIKHCQYYKQ